MKKLFIALTAIILGMSAQAQVLKVYKDGTLVHTYKSSEGNKFVFEVEQAYVDLGLPSGTLWATCNVGAESPEGYGNYYAWGETEPQADNSYSWSSYKWSNGTSWLDPRLTKYCNDSCFGNNGFTDTKTVLDAEDDAATANWGIGWCMPTIDQWKELRTNCTWTWTTENGVYGCKVTATNGKSIFLPAAGCRNDGSLNNAGSYGDYWSCSLLASGPNNARNVYFSSGNVSRSSTGRCHGYSVRPVRSE